MSSDPAERRHTPLAEKLAERIGRTGPISVAEYVQACLHDPEHGYYRARAGIARDFITAPEISQMFGELIGLWCSVVWQQMGSPSQLRLIELGPGRGTMMRDMLSAGRLVPDYLSALHIHLVETSGPLRIQQQSLLRDPPAPITWLDAMPEPASSVSIIVANEFLDTLPTNQYVQTKAGWAERTISVDAQGLLQYACGKPPGAAILKLLSRRFPGAREHDIAEVEDFSLVDWLIAQARQHMTAALLIDYGYERSASGDTLQAVRQHRYEHPLCSPGEADLTMHVNFEALTHRLTATHHLVCDGPATQAEFLGTLGLVERASRLMAANPAKALEIETAVQRLLAPGGMGTRFKVLGTRSPQLPPLPGLTASRAIGLPRS
jgi:SAM-dependent MidA family methyltransferase